MFIKLFLLFLNLVLPEKRKGETEKQAKKKIKKDDNPEPVKKKENSTFANKTVDAAFDRLTGQDGAQEAALMELQPFDHEKIKLDSFIIVVG